MAKKKLSEKEIDRLYVVVKGFNVGDEPYVAPGTEDKPTFVTEKDFDKKDWDELVDNGAVVLFEKDEPLRPDESIAAEIIK